MIFITNQSTHIKVVDSIMGSGKTSAAINLMNNDNENNYIFITPFLSEVERVKKSCTNKRFYEPIFYSRNGELHTKFDSLHSLLINNKNIASTHALFKRANEETKELIHSGNYILILDEVLDVVEQLQLKKNDLSILFDTKLIYEKDGYVHWNEELKEYDTRYNDIRDMAMNKNLIYYANTILIWTFPADIFRAFKEVYILTYQFNAQVQRYYYDMNKIRYKKYIAKQVNGVYTIVEGIDEIEKQLKQQLKNKIHIYDGNLNKIGDRDYSLSKTWYKNGKEILAKLKNNTENYFRNKVKAKSNEILWTTFKEYQSKIKGRGYAKSFLACTSRATNEYKDKKYLAYTINLFSNPIINNFFKDKGVEINEDLYSLSELLQWTWRSAIREGNEIHIYIPSRRMRTLLIRWLDDDI